MGWVIYDITESLKSLGVIITDCEKAFRRCTRRTFFNFNFTLLQMSSFSPFAHLFPRIHSPLASGHHQPHGCVCLLDYAYMSFAYIFMLQLGIFFIPFNNCPILSTSYFYNYSFMVISLFFSFLSLLYSFLRLVASWGHSKILETPEVPMHIALSQALSQHGSSHLQSQQNLSLQFPRTQASVM